MESDSKSTRLVTVAVVQSWNPPSLAMAKEIEKMRKNGLVKSPILLIDADAEPAACRDMGSQPQRDAGRIATAIRTRQPVVSSANLRQRERTAD